MTGLRDYTEEYRSLGMSLAGRYDGISFIVDAPWKRVGTVYVWSEIENDARRPVRVGQTGSTGGRHSSYNSWLAGRFKPQDPVEQEKARIARTRLPTAAELWAREVSDKRERLRLEALLIARWHPLLDLNFDVPDSFASTRLMMWRRSSRVNS